MKIKCTLVFSLLSLAVMGCDHSAPPHSSAPEKKTAASSQASETPAAKTPAVSEAAPAEIKVEVVDAESFAAALKKHEGKVIFIDFWATWCSPCIKRFPETVELFRKYADQGLVVFSFSTDDLDDLPAVKEFLAQQKHSFAFKGEHYISKFGLGTETAKAFDVGAVPDFRLYDRQGKLRQRWKDEEIAQLKEETIAAEIEKLLVAEK